MSEIDRLLSGKLFDAHSQELMDIKHKSHTLCQEYNILNEYEIRRVVIVKEILGECGNNVVFQGPIQFNYGCNTKIGNNFYANFNFTVLDDGLVTIGNDVMIGPNVSIMASSHPLIAKERLELKYEDGHIGRSEYSKPITIGNNVWIACGVIICAGVTIGDGAVVGAGSVVTKDIPENYFACGIPCKPIRLITEKDSKLDLL